MRSQKSSKFNELDAFYVGSVDDSSRNNRRLKDHKKKAPKKIKGQPFNEFDDDEEFEA